MKTLVIKTLSLAFLMLVLTNCDNLKVKEETSSSSSQGTGNLKLNGTWEIVKADGPMAEANVTKKYIFDGNKLTVRSGEFDEPGTTMVTDSTFTWEVNGLVTDFKYKMEGAQLVAEEAHSGGQKFWMEKR